MRHLVESYRTSDHWLIKLFGHERHHTTRVYAPAQKSSERNIASKSDLNGFTEKMTQLLLIVLFVAERLMPFYAHCEKLGLPLFLHPTDVIFQDILDGYDGALHLGLGRIIEVSVAAMRLILSGTMERHPDLKIVLSHTGGALPYQAGRMDKNSKAAKLPKPVTAYMKRMFTDTVSPHATGMQFAIDYFGIDRVMYGTDYPCWDPAACLKLLEDVRLTEADKRKVFYDNARRILGLKDPPLAKSAKGEPVLA